MKKIITLLVFVFITNSIFSQEESQINKFVLGGSLSISTQNNTIPLSVIPSLPVANTVFTNVSQESQYSNFSLRPYLAKEISSKMLVGVSLSFIHNSSTTTSIPSVLQPEAIESENSYLQLGFGAFTRHSLNPTSQFVFYVQPFINYFTGNRDRTIDGVPETTEKNRFINLGVGIGGLYNINEKIRLTLGTGVLDYYRGKWEIEGTGLEDDFNGFSSSINLTSLRLGFELRV